MRDAFKSHQLIFELAVFHPVFATAETARAVARLGAGAGVEYPDRPARPRVEIGTAPRLSTHRVQIGDVKSYPFV